MKAAQPAIRLAGTRQLVSGMLVLLLSSPAWAKPAPLHPQLELGLGADDNLNRARDGLRQRGSNTDTLALSLPLSIQLNQLSVVSFQPAVEVQGVARYSGLNSTRVQLGARYQLRPGRSFYTPTLSLSSTLGRLDSQSAARDAYEQRYRFSLRESVTTRLQLQAGFEHVHQQARAAVFNLNHRSLDLSLGYALRANWQLRAGWQFQRGEFVTTISGLGALPGGARVVMADAVFAEGERSVQLAGRSQRFSLDSLCSLSPQWAIETGAAQTLLKSDANRRYQRWQGQISVIWRY